MSETIKYTIRRARPMDLEPVFLLSNDPVVREQSIHPQPITHEQHVDWFSRKIKDPDYIFLVIYDRQKKFIGQVRFEIKNESAVISISIRQEFRGKGLTTSVLTRTITKVLKMKSDLRQIIAYIKPENMASSRSFINAGFVHRERKMINNKSYNIFILKRPSWI